MRECPGCGMPRPSPRHSCEELRMGGPSDSAEGLDIPGEEEENEELEEEEEEEGEDDEPSDFGGDSDYSWREAERKQMGL